MKDLNDLKDLNDSKPSNEGPETIGNIMAWDEVRKHRKSQINRAAYGRRIREAREMLGWSQTKLAEALKVPNTWVSNWESGAVRPDVDLVPLICRCLGMNVETFFGMPMETRDLTREEKSFLRDYRNLAAEDQAVVDRVMRGMFRLERQALHAECLQAFEQIPHYDADDYFAPRHGQHRTQVRRQTWRQRPDFLVTVCGDSLLQDFPDYPDDTDLMGQKGPVSDGELAMVAFGQRVLLMRRSGSRFILRDGGTMLEVPEGEVQVIGRIFGRLIDRDRPDALELAVLGGAKTEDPEKTG